MDKFTHFVLMGNGILLCLETERKFSEKQSRCLALKIGPEVVDESVGWGSSRGDRGENEMQDYGGARGNTGIESGLQRNAYCERSGRFWNEAHSMFVKALQNTQFNKE